MILTIAEDKIKGMFGGSKDSTSSQDESTVIGDTRSETASSSAASESASPSPSAEKNNTEPPAPPAKIQDTYPLRIDTKPMSIPALTPSEVSRAKGRLAALDVAEAAKRRRADALNSLESYLYRMRDLLENDGDDTPFVRCSQEVERKAMREKMEETLGWLHDAADSATLLELLDKRDAVE